MTWRDSEGNVSMLQQSAGNIYSWNGVSNTLVGSVPASSRIRGRLEHAWDLDDRVLITDLSLQQPISDWDGTTFRKVSHNLNNEFFAKYCFVADEEGILCERQGWHGNAASYRGVLSEQLQDSLAFRPPSIGLERVRPFFPPNA